MTLPPEPTPPTPSPFIEVDPDLAGPPARPLEVTLLVACAGVASVVCVFWGLSALFVGGSLCCCFAPIATLELVLGIVGLVYTGRQFSSFPPPLPAWLAVAFIATLLACDVVSAVLGIVMLVLAQTDGARVYYTRCALAKMAAGAG